MGHASAAWDALGESALALVLFVSGDPGRDGGWSRARLTAEGDAEGVDQLVAGGWLVEFGEDLTLSPWGAWDLRRTLVERAETHPIWTTFVVDDRGNIVVANEPTSLVTRMIDGERKLPEWLTIDPVSPHLTPDYEAILGEAVGYLRQAERCIEEGRSAAADGWRRLAEAAVDGHAGEMKSRWAWDEVSGLPKVCFGQVVPIDPRLGPKRAG
jgi:hypothetical protein